MAGLPAPAAPARASSSSGASSPSSSSSSASPATPPRFSSTQTATREEIAHARHLLGLDRPLRVQYARLPPRRPRAATSACPSRQRRPALRHRARASLAGHRRARARPPSCWPRWPPIPLGVLAATHRGGGRRSPEPARLAVPPVDAELLAGSHADPALRGRAGRAAAGLRLGSAAPPDPPRADAGGRAARPERPADPLGHARGAQQDYVRTARAKGLAERGVDLSPRARATRPARSSPSPGFRSASC